MKKLLFTIVLVATLFGYNFVEESLYSNKGTRATAFGGAYTGIGLGAEAIWYNPASLARGKSSFYYNEADRLGNEYGRNIQKALKMGGFAFGIQDIMVNNQKANISTFSLKLLDHDGVGAGLSYHRVFYDSANVDNFVDKGVGTLWDAGLEFRLTPTFKIGLLAKNFSVSRLPVSPSWRYGFSKEWGAFLFAYDRTVTQLYGESNYLRKNHAGVEYRIFESLALLYGTSTDGYAVGFNFMFGNLDYYIAHEKINGEFRHYFSLGVGVKENTLSGKRQTVAFSRKDYLLLDLRQPLKAGTNLYSLFGGRVMGADYLADVINRAKLDNKIGGIVIRLGHIPNNLSTSGLMEELRGELQLFKDKGTKVVVYIEGDANGNSYYLASIGDRIYLTRNGSVSMLGKSITVTRLKGLLERFGITPETYTVGEYKDSTSPYRDSYTKAQRERLEALVVDINNTMSAPIRERVVIGSERISL